MAWKMRALTDWLNNDWEGRVSEGELIRVTSRRRKRMLEKNNLAYTVPGHPGEAAEPSGESDGETSESSHTPTQERQPPELPEEERELEDVATPAALEILRGVADEREWTTHEMVEEVLPGTGLNDRILKVDAEHYREDPDGYLEDQAERIEGGE